MKNTKAVLSAFLVLLVITSAAPGQELNGTLKKIKDSATFTLCLCGEYSLLTDPCWTKVQYTCSIGSVYFPASVPNAGETGIKVQ